MKATYRRQPSSPETGRTAPETETGRTSGVVDVDVHDAQGPAGGRGPRPLQHGVRRRGARAMTRGSRDLGDVVAGAPDPGRTALIDLAEPAAPRERSFDDLNRAASAVSRGLLAHGGKRGDRVAILSTNRAEYLTVFLGAMRAGLVVVPVNLKLPAAAIEHILSDSGVCLIFVDRERRPMLPAGTVAVEFGAELDAFVDPCPFAAVVPGADAVAMVLYTSGSSGLPEGVPLTHAGAFWTAENRLRAARDIESQRLLVAAPLYHMNALW